MNNEEQNNNMKRYKRISQNVIQLVAVLIILSIIGIIVAPGFVAKYKKNENSDLNRLPNTTTKARTTIKTNSTTTKPVEDPNKYVEAISVDNPDYGINNKSGLDYYTREFILYNGDLYAEIDPKNEYTKELIEKTIKINNKNGYLIKEKIKNVFVVESGNKGYHYAFATGTNGEFYYINNIKDSKSRRFEMKLVNGFINIVDVISRSTDGEKLAIAINDKDTYFSLVDSIDKYANLY